MLRNEVPFFLLRDNFPNNQFPRDNLSSLHKHFIPWFDLELFGINRITEESEFEKEKRAQYCTYIPNTLFVFIIRNPYDWVRSFYRMGYHVSDDLCNKGLYHFISSTWKANTPNGLIRLDNHNPYEDRPFKNVLELRKYKTLNYLQLGSMAENFIVVNFEDLRADPEGFLNYLCKEYNLKRGPIQKISTRRSAYPPFNRTENSFINNNLCWEVESLFGYQINKY